MDIDVFIHFINEKISQNLPKLLPEIKLNDTLPVVHLEGKGFQGTALYLPFALPEHMWEAHTNPSFLLPGGKEDIQNHQTHISITIEAGDDKKAVLEAANMLTEFAAALQPSVVAWFPGEVYARGDLFQKFSQEMPKQNLLPLLLWCQIYPHVNKDTQMVSAVTYGLIPFLGFDLVLPPQKAKTISQLINSSLPLLDYLTKTPENFKLGDTLGTTSKDINLIFSKPDIEFERNVLELKLPTS